MKMNEVLLEKLCNACGVSGDEGRVRKIIAEEIKPFADSLETDRLGNLTAFKKGKRSDKKIMLSAHMDEVGFIISKITDTGYLRFKTVGGIDTRVILGKRVVLSGGTRGIIGVKAVHLLSKGERSAVPKVSELYIDVGAETKSEAEKYTFIGDYATFDTEYEHLGGSRIKAKAIDDRAGCAVLAGLLKEVPEYDMYACFTVQEEVGLRGSGVCAYRLRPDAALVLESTTCSDVYKTKPGEQVTVCGGGAALSFMDGRTITDREHLEGLIRMAERNKIPVQLKKTTMGGNDAGSIHLAAEGIVTAGVSVPCRYLHSPAGIADMKDIEAMELFARAYIEEIGGIMKWSF